VTILSFGQVQALPLLSLTLSIPPPIIQQLSVHILISSTCPITNLELKKLPRKLKSAATSGSNP
jgi:hypothetical protein